MNILGRQGPERGANESTLKLLLPINYFCKGVLIIVSTNQFTVIHLLAAAIFELHLGGLHSAVQSWIAPGVRVVREQLPSNGTTTLSFPLKLQGSNIGTPDKPAYMPQLNILLY